MPVTSKQIAEVSYFQPVWYRTFFAAVLSLLSAGIFFLVAYAYKKPIWVKLTCRACRTDEARWALVRFDDSTECVAKLDLISKDGLLLGKLQRASFATGSKYVTTCFRIGSDAYAVDKDSSAYVDMSFKHSSTEVDSDSLQKRAVLNKGQDDQQECVGFKKVPYRDALVKVCYFVTAGALWLLLYWKPPWKVKLTHTQSSLVEADCILLTDSYKQTFVRPVRFITRDGIKIRPLHRLQAARYFSFRAFAQAAVVRYITVQKLRYFWTPEHRQFEKYEGLLGAKSATFAEIHQNKGMSREEESERRSVAGKNTIEVCITPIINIVIRAVLSPFYMFQIFSCILWFCDEYYIYAASIVLMSSMSIAWTVYLTRSNERALRRTVHAAQAVVVCRPDGTKEEIMPDLLVPGDVIIIPRHGNVMQCDAVIQCGNCIVNESMLTGESVPATKTSLPTVRNIAEDQFLNAKLHEKHILFCGTSVIQTRYYANKPVKAVVLSTGFMTAKGNLIRSILFPKPMDFKFIIDAMKFVGLMAVIAGIGLVYSLVIRLQRKEDATTIIFRCLDLFTIVVPPALPIALSVGYATAQRRLKKQKIFCVSPSAINVCGVVDIVCFDKTGTLTEDGLDFSRVVPNQRGRFEAPITTGNFIEPRSQLAICMATCHSLAVIDNEITGDPIDLKMFEETGWELEEPDASENDSTEAQARFEVLTPVIVRPRRETMERSLLDEGSLPFEVGIIRQFPFSSSLQRMSVITRLLGEKYYELYLKGAPEVVVSLCQPHTVPRDFSSELILYTQQGYRVLGLAYKPLPTMNYAKTQRVERQSVETGLEFIGLLVMENRLKSETAPVISQLRNARIRCLMLTGDNMLTALSVGRGCKLVAENDQIVLVNAQAPQGKGSSARPKIEFLETLSTNSSPICDDAVNGEDGDSVVAINNDSLNMRFAITGKSWTVLREYFPEYVPRIVVRGSIFARFTPLQKQQLVEALRDLRYYVAMCGDGANDCGGLKTAHAGISLSEAEASVASPFTSQNPNVECVPTVIREGRAALVTSFGVFRFVICFSLIQFTAVCLLYKVGASLSDVQFLYTDLAILTSLGFTFTLTEAYSNLVPERPPASLLAPKPVLSLIIYLTVNFAFQVVAFFIVRIQPWYEKMEKENVNDHETSCYENYSVFCVSSFQYLSMAIVLSKGPPFRKAIFSNWLFIVNLFVVSISNAVLTIAPPDFAVESFELKLPPLLSFRSFILGLALLNLVVCLAIERGLIEATWPGKLANKLRRHCRVKKRRSCSYDDEPSWAASHTLNNSHGDAVVACNSPHVQTTRSYTSSRSLTVHHEIVSQQLASHPEWPPVSPASDIHFLQEVVYSPSTPAMDYSEDEDGEDKKLLS